MPSLGGQFIKTGVNDESEALIGKRSRLGRIMMMIFVGSSLTIVPLPIFDGLITTGGSQLSTKLFFGVNLINIYTLISVCP